MPHGGQRTLLAAFFATVMNASAFNTLHAQTSGESSSSGAAAASVEDQGRRAELTLAVKDHGIKLGDVIVTPNSDGSIKIRRQSLLIAIRDVFRADALRDLEAALAADEYIDLNAIVKAGLAISYDANSLELLVEPKVEQRPRGEIDGTVRNKTESSDIIVPASLSGFVNTRVGVVYERNETSPGKYEIPAIMLNGAGRWKGVVLEGEALFQFDGTLARQSTRLVYDTPETAIRVTGGDLELRPNGSFSIPPLFGVSIEKSYTELQPSKNVRPTGKRSFRLERASEVQVMVNGSEARRLRLQPGEYDLNDLPLASGTNNVQLRIKDEFGKEEAIDFSILFNRTLLDPGISEWSLAGGIQAHAGLLSPSYEEDVPMITGAYRLGLSESVTGSISAQASNDVALTGVNVLSPTYHGLASLDAAISQTNDGTNGWSASVELEVDNKRLFEPFTSAQLGAEFTSKNFVPSLNQAPNEGSRTRVSGAVGQRLPAGISTSISGYYQLAEEELDRGFGTSFSLNHAVSQAVSIGLSGSYDYRPEAELGAASVFSLFARLNYRPSTDSYVRLQYDQASNATSAASGSNFEEGAKRASVDLEWGHTPSTDHENSETIASADLYYADSRIEVNASHGRNFERLASGTTSRRTSANAGMGIAFADGHVAFGRPVRSGYAIVDLHESLAESTVRIAPFQDSYKAGSDGLGPLLVSDLSAYTRSSVPYDADNLPTGYDIGSGALEFFAPYKAGFHARIGSDFAVTAVGTLLDSEGKPVALQAGTVSTPIYPDKRIIVFTNAEGNFTAPGLKPGDWNIALNEEPVKNYVLRIPENAGAYAELGGLHPKD